MHLHLCIYTIIVRFFHPQHWLLACSVWYDRCELLPVIVEVDRVLRPEGRLIVRDNIETISEVENIVKSLHWEVHMSYSQDKEGLLFVQKTTWRPNETEDKLWWQHSPWLQILWKEEMKIWWGNSTCIICRCLQSCKLRESNVRRPSNFGRDLCCGVELFFEVLLLFPFSLCRFCRASVAW